MKDELVTVVKRAYIGDKELENVLVTISKQKLEVGRYDRFDIKLIRKVRILTSSKIFRRLVGILSLLIFLIAAVYVDLNIGGLEGSILLLIVIIARGIAYVFKLEKRAFLDYPIFIDTYIKERIILDDPDKEKILKIYNKLIEVTKRR